MAFGPYTPTPTLRQTAAPSSGDVPNIEEIRQLREYIDSLQKGQGEGYNGHYTGWNALADTITGGLAGHARSQLNASAKEGSKYDESSWDKLEQARQSLQQQLADALKGRRGSAQGVPDQSPPSEGLPKGALAMLEPEGRGSLPPSSPSGQTTTEPLSRLTSSQDGPLPNGLPPGQGPSSAAEALLGPTSKVAQAYPPNALTRSPKDWNDLLGQAYFGMGGAYARRGYSPAEQALMAERAQKGIQSVMPQYDVSPQGQIITHQAGKVPTFGGTAPGSPGQISVEPDMGGALGQTQIDRNGNVSKKIIVPQIAPAPGRRSEAPVISPGGVGLAGGTEPAPGSNNAPAAPIALPAPKSMLGVTPPKLAPWQVAMNSDIGQIPVPTANGVKTAAAATAEELAPVSRGLNPANPVEKTAQQYLDAALKDPPKDLQMPKIIGPAFESGDIDALANIKPTREAAKNVLEQTQTEQNKIYSKAQAGITETADQGIKLRQSLKTAKKVLNSPDFQSGPFNKPVEFFQASRQELGELSRQIANDESNSQGVRDAAKKTADWALDKDNHTATTNQVYTKLIAGTILQGMRGMLGSGAGRFMQSELALMQQVLGNTSLTPEANKAVLNMFDKVNDRNILIGKMADEYASHRGKLDPKFDQYMLKFQEEHPAYSEDEFNDVLKLTAGGQPKETTTETPKGTAPTVEPPKGFKKPPPWQR